MFPHLPACLITHTGARSVGSPRAWGINNVANTEIKALGRHGGAYKDDFKNKLRTREKKTHMFL